MKNLLNEFLELELYYKLLAIMDIIIASVLCYITYQIVIKGIWSI